MRERVLLFGDVAARPEGLLRALARAGFGLVDGETSDPASPPDLALVAVRDGGSDLEGALARFSGEVWAGVPVIVLLATDAGDGVARALALGADDALAQPVNLSELGARLEARLRNRDAVRRAAGSGALQSGLFLAIEEIASAPGPHEMLEILVRRVGEALGAAHCACLTPSPDRRHARFIAVHGSPSLSGVAVDLFRYPEAVEAAVSRRTVYAGEVLRHSLFLSHLAHWPDSPEVHEIESAAAVPLIAHRNVRAVIVLRTRRGETPLTPAHVTLVEQLANATAALLAREETRLGAAGPALPAATDPLTGCAGLEVFGTRLRDELERARRYDSTMALAILQIEGLDHLTARLGIGVSDAVLAELGVILRAEIRAPDLVARYGKERFALLLPSTGMGGGERLLERVLGRAASRAFKGLPPEERPRLAAGLVAFPRPGVKRPEDLLAIAEAAVRVKPEVVAA